MQPEMEAIRYSHTIVRHVGVINGLPRFDLVLLGLGDDGHTASIFPGHTDLFSSPNICEVATQPNSGQQRITITGGVINQAAEVLFMVTGKSKAGAVHAVIEKKDPMLPATFVYPLSGKLTWLLDHESSSRLKERLNG
jgi:6-phosphogluconolactonase